MAQPSQSFNEALLKIIWAKDHIPDLETVCNGWLEMKPYEVSFETDPESGQHQFKVGFTQPFPAQIPLMVGDIVANLRAALDFCWMGLVRAENPVPEKRTLPIADNRKGLESTIERAPIGASVAKAKRLLGDEIASHRDFANGGNMALVALNELSNWNKHNMLVVSAGVTRLSNVRIGGLTIRSLNVKGGVATIVGIGGGQAKPDLHYDGDPTVEIVFGEHDFVSGEPVLPTVINFVQICAKALQGFCEAFPSPENPTFT